MLRTRILVTLLAALSVSAFVPLGTGHEHGEENYRTFTGTYNAGLGWSDVSFETGSPGLMAALVTCGKGTEWGGSCAPTFVDQGETIQIDLQDESIPEVRFMACVDGDWDGICRPEFPADRIYIEPCTDGDNRLTVPHRGPMGALDVYVLHGLENGCIPTRGLLDGLLHRPQPECSDLQDNDGDGAADYPLDNDCSSPFDNIERPPQCRDQRDNDASGRTDFPADPGCSSPEDDYEWSPECSNLRDDDRDGRTDMADSDCTSPSDNSERPVRVN